MKTMQIEVHVDGPDGKQVKQNLTLLAVGVSHEEIRKHAMEVLKQHSEFPPVRSLSFTVDGRLVAYCAHPPHKPLEHKGQTTVWRKPPGAKHK